MTTAQFRINTPHVIQETIEGEAIIVNMVSGNYYSIAGVGSVIWDAIVQGRPTAAVAASIVAGFDADPATGRADLDRLLTELQAEELIVPVESGAAAAAESPVASAEPKRPYEPPMLHKYNDMQDLLLLDPVHDVDETGWPNISPEKV